MAKLMNRQMAFQRGVDFIAMNDNADSRDGIEDIASYISVVTLSEVFGCDALTVAGAVLNLRKIQPTTVAILGNMLRSA